MLNCEQYTLRATCDVSGFGQNAAVSFAGSMVTGSDTRPATVQAVNALQRAAGPRPAAIQGQVHPFVIGQIGELFNAIHRVPMEASYCLLSSQHVLMHLHRCHARHSAGYSSTSR